MNVISQLLVFSLLCQARPPHATVIDGVLNDWIGSPKVKIKDWKPIDPTVSNFVEDQKNIYLNPGYGGQAYPRFSSYPGRLQCRRQLAQWANAIGEQGQQTHIMSVISDMNPPSVTLKKSLS